MRKSDKLKNFKKANLLAENRYFESKGFEVESYNEIDETSMDVNEVVDPKTEEIAFKNVKNDLYNLLYKSSYPFGYLSIENVRTIRPEQISPRQLDDRIDKIIEYLNSTKSGRNYDSPEYKDSWDKIEKGDINLAEENIFSRAVKKVKDFGDRVLDIPSKENEAKKQKAIEEIMKFDFKDLFYQPYEGELLNAETANRLIGYAATAMPTVKELNPILFEIKGGYFSNAIMEKDGKRIRGVIPSCFEPIRDVNDEINNEEAIRRMIGYLG